MNYPRESSIGDILLTRRLDIDNGSGDRAWLFIQVGLIIDRIRGYRGDDVVIGGKKKKETAVVSTCSPAALCRKAAVLPSARPYRA